MTTLKKLYYAVNAPAQILPPYTGLAEALRRFNFQTGRYHKLGLYHDDCLWEYPHVEEAIRRLPLDVQDERNHRMLRAIQLDIRQIFLPKDQWTKYEDDRTKGRYLQPYINDVLKEIAERDRWEAEH